MIDDRGHIESNLNGKEKYTFPFIPFLSNKDHDKLLSSSFLYFQIHAALCIVPSKTFLTQPPDFLKNMCN